MFPGYSQEYIEPSTAQDERYSFIAEWYDPQAALIRRYQFLFYPKDNSIEMFDMKNRRKFLARTKSDTVKMEDMFIGNKIHVYSRQLTFVDFGDKFTEGMIGVKNERTLAIVKPEAVNKIGVFLNILKKNDIKPCKIKMLKLSRKKVAEFYEEHQSKPFFNTLLEYMSSAPVIAMELMGAGVIKKWRSLLGPTDSLKAKETDPNSIRAKYGTDTTSNAAHGSDSEQSANRELDFFFPPGRSGGFDGTSQLTDCTCCIIKPHAVRCGVEGDIIEAIQNAGFQISALEMFNVETANGEEFYEIYKGVVSEYPNMVTEICSGPCIALEITGKGSDTASQLRELCGPSDPEIARHLRPKTLRAMFGKDKIQNAVHCTDLPEDGVLEVEYFFRILSN